MNSIKNSNKDYIKYENGEIVSINASEKKATHKNDTKAIVAKIKPKNIKNKINKESIRTHLTSINWQSATNKIFLTLMFISLILCYFLFIKDKDIFNIPTFQKTINTTTPSEAPAPPTISVDGNDLEVVKPTTKPSTQEPQNIDEPVNPEANIDGSNLTTIHDVYNYINSSLDTLLEEETLYINSYYSNKINKPSLVSFLNKKALIKEDLYIELYINEALFDNDRTLFDLMESRILNSIKLSNATIDGFNSFSTRNKMVEIRNPYLETEGQLLADISSWF